MTHDRPGLSESGPETGRAELRCCACGYGGIASGPPPACPMCQASAGAASLAPVVVGRPVPGELLHGRELDALRPIGNESSAGASASPRCAGEVIQLLLGNLQVEGLDLGWGAFGRRAVTERAKGILMERHSIDEPAAFEMLREHARSTNRKLVDGASAVLDGHRLLPKQPHSLAPTHEARG